jgi:hypothetical protein
MQGNCFIGGMRTRPGRIAVRLGSEQHSDVHYASGVGVHDAAGSRVSDRRRGGVSAYALLVLVIYDAGSLDNQGRSELLKCSGRQDLMGMQCSCPKPGELGCRGVGWASRIYTPCRLPGSLSPLSKDVRSRAFTVRITFRGTTVRIVPSCTTGCAFLIRQSLVYGATSRML